ncbi:MAG: 2-amino-4-hydroxy-6-hydroxymethyldihydropteridine diphosphokinase [Armatimonadota bacterium]
MTTAYIGIGSNIEPEINIKIALIELSKKLNLKAISNFYITEPFGTDKGDIFYNGAVEVETNLEPYVLKYDLCRKIEEDLGRFRTDDKYAPRTIDLDILVYDNICINEPELVIPDPDIYKRPFVCVPLYELAPNLILPDTKKSLAEIAQSAPLDNMKELSVFTSVLREEILE